MFGVAKDCDLDFGCAGVFHHVIERFLNDAIEVDAQIVRESVVDVVDGGIDFNSGGGGDGTD